MFDVKQLRVLKAVADHGSFSAAADALSYSQPAISQQIAALEKRAGTRSWTAAAGASGSPTPGAPWSTTRRS